MDSLRVVVNGCGEFILRKAGSGVSLGQKRLAGVGLLRVRNGSLCALTYGWRGITLGE